MNCVNHLHVAGTQVIWYIVHSCVYICSFSWCINPLNRCAVIGKSLVQYFKVELRMNVLTLVQKYVSAIPVSIR